MSGGVSPPEGEVCKKSPVGELFRVPPEGEVGPGKENLTVSVWGGELFKLVREATVVNA